MDRSPLRRYVGLKIDVDVTEIEIKRYARAVTSRLLYPNTPMTLDLRQDRVNIHVDEDGIIQRVSMG